MLQQPGLPADDLVVSDQDLVVNRWRRYGKDRLYVTLPDESKIGFWDLVTGEGHPESPEHLPALLAAVEAWKAAQEAESTGASDPMPAVAPAASIDASTDAAETGLADLLAGKPVPPDFEPDPDAPSRVIESATRDLPTETPVRPWLDLASNQAGAEAREQALAAREAAPVKTTLARVLGVHTDERAWRIGADGEEKVAAQLAKVAKKDPRWRFLHAIPVGDRGSDIDHLIIGPGGVFTVNAKNHPKAKIWVGGNTLMVNGHKQPYVRNSRYEATRAAKMLTAACGFPVLVEGLIVTVNAADVTIKNQPDGVSVTWRNNLAKWVLRHGDILDDETVAAIYEAARRSTTWRT